MKSFINSAVKFFKPYRLTFAAASAGLIILGVLAGIAWWENRDRLEPFQVLESTRSTSDQFLELGKQYEIAEQYQDAEQAYLKAIYMDPALQLAAYSALDTLYQAHMPEKQSYMVHVYNQGISRNNRSRVLMRALAQLHERQGQKELAVQWYRRILSLYPTDGATRQDLFRITGQQPQ